MPYDAPPAPLTDSFGRAVTYLRVSVTDRCDLRCTYCMAEKMAFLPRKDLVSLEDLARLTDAFVDLGVRKVRVTGGEPLVRRNVLDLFRHLARRLDAGQVDEVTLTTNGTQLPRYAYDLAALGVRRVNVSLDSLSTDRYQKITRIGALDKVLAGLDAAQKAGLKVKLNALASRGPFEREVDDLIRFAHGRDMDLTLIEEMPMGKTGLDRAASFLPISELRRDLATRWTLLNSDHRTGGPAEYVDVAETGGRIGFITAMTCGFCSACNRVRLSCTGKLYTCMADEGSVDLREGPSGWTGDLHARIRAAVQNKPKGHRFLENGSCSATQRHMSALGG
ncbi:GTP 3',8-cyclase MoaA [Aliiruegeria sabulilitoris]|uniref:GTP 3',8-cyclase MoaA n=1 Tax=Aliiruegeria sabulilitoris TaxID=1510458 RepID=UPI00082D7F1B|nr:GTP 3',8-cyclase MoaA [Aliiruegeria sabulilitoris]NDR55706.1 GTP 3',8-cyclase MoaA [Pseudoruegeria sp. M32A2M]